MIEITDLVTNAHKVTSWCAKSFDLGYYRELVDKAWREI
jgi:hypothetical protein